jgi:hypothetical protein
LPIDSKPPPYPPPYPSRDEDEDEIEDEVRLKMLGSHVEVDELRALDDEGMGMGRFRGERSTSRDVELGGGERVDTGGTGAGRQAVVDVEVEEKEEGRPWSRVECGW